MQQQLLKGLQSQEIATLRKEYGSNGFRAAKRQSFFARMLGNLSDPMLVILQIALLASALVQFMHFLKGQSVEWIELVGIAIAILLASFTATFFEHRNERSFQALQSSAAKGKVKVLRDESWLEIGVDEVVRGELILLEMGDKIAADGYVVQGEILVDQSLLNGEALEMRKVASEVALEAMSSDLLNEHFVFRGTTVLDGRAYMRVLAVGDQSIYGSLAQGLQQNSERDTPLRIKLKHLAKLISRFGYVGGALMAVLSFFYLANSLGPSLADAGQIYLNDTALLFDHFLQALMMAVILVVVAVPEGLPLMVAIVCAMMMNRMLKDQVLVRNNAGIETAGSLNILFTDKTGTLTKGHLEVAALWQAGKIVPKPSQILQRLILTTSQSQWQSQERAAIGGNSTDRALLSWLMQKHASDQLRVWAQQPLNGKLVPFNSQRKWQAVVKVRKNGQPLSLIKGAPERLLPLCKSYIDEQGKQQPMDESFISAYEEQLASWSKQSMRLLVFAMGAYDISDRQILSAPLALLGIVAIRDEVRSEVIAAVQEVQQAGVQVVMITGDRKETALAIASEVGILTEDGVALDSSQLNQLSDSEIVEQLPKLAVVSRALPSDKSRLVRLAKGLNLVVGMTGDGVNDGPALKSADVGFAMGSGTEVAKEASDIIIMDDNFVSIRQAILYGRTIYKNIQRFIVFQLTINFSAVLVTLFFPIIGYQPPLKITQMLWVNLVMDSLAALAFGGEMALKRYLKERPKRRDEAIIKPFMLEQILVMSLGLFGVSLYMLFSLDMAMFFRYGSITEDAWSTAYFSFFVLAAVANAFNVRTNELNPLVNIQGNPTFWQVMLVIAGVQVLLSSFGGRIIDGYGLSIGSWFVVIFLSFLAFLLGVAHKAIRASYRLGI